MPGKYSQTKANACATTGTASTFIVKEGARLREIILNEVDDDAAVSYVEISWTSSPSPLKFAPNVVKQLVATNGAGIALGSAKIPLDVVVRNATTVTVTAYGNTAAVGGLSIGLRWD